MAAIDDPAALACDDEAGGGSVTSVPTEPRHFGGSLDDLAAVRERVAVPVLRSLHHQLLTSSWEARANGADMVLRNRWRWSRTPWCRWSSGPCR